MWELYHGLHDGTYGEYLGILHARFAEAMVRFGILRPSWWERVDIGDGKMGRLSSSPPVKLNTLY